MTLDFAVLGVDSFDPRSGAKAADEEEARVNRVMAGRASTLIVVADSSKFDAHAFATICPVSEVNYLISDRATTNEIVDSLNEQGVRIIRA
jgi:DeoR/GlpR family transcriptional regulator of sugar metabolism